jgi:hypothetical protein
MAHPQTWLEATKCAKEAQQVVFSQNKKPSFLPLPRPTNPSPPATPLKVQKLTGKKWLNANSRVFSIIVMKNIFLGTSVRNKIFLWPFQRMLLKRKLKFPLLKSYPLQMLLLLPTDPPEVEPLISLHALTGFSAPQTLKLIGYIKHRKVIILVDSGSTHNFIHRRISQEINCYICVVNNFQIMIANGGSMKCGGCCENVCLQIGSTT